MELQRHIDEMRNLGNALVEHTFPKAKYEVEDDISVLRIREVTIDGYPVKLLFSRADYGTHFVESFQIFGQKVPFLPFSLVVKVARRFLGDKHLSLLEVFSDQKKIYIWTVTTDREGKVQPPIQDSIKDCNFEGFEYSYMNPAQVNLF
jgi:hypothetical protein